VKVLNFVIGIAVIGVLWMLVGIGLNSVLANNIPFQNITPEKFVVMYRTTSFVVAIFTVILFAIWYFYGSRDKVTLNLKGAKNTWVLLFITSIILTIVQVIYMTITTQNEGVPILYLLMIFGGTSLIGWVGYWLVSYFWSPNNVKYCVLAKKVTGED